MSGRVTLLVALLAGATAACSGGTTSATRSPAPEVTAPTTTAPQPSAAPTSAEAAPSIRDGDILDVEELAAIMAADAEGDEEWIEIFAELRAASWLWSRYPGRYEVLDIYSEQVADQTARPNEADWLRHEVYLDEPLPSLVSVTKTRTLGQLTELEVVLDGGIAIIRRESDDRPEGDFPGGRARALFTVAPDGPDGRWRIHSVVELKPLDDPESEESKP